MEGVKRIEDLNLSIFCTQGIVGVGVDTPTSTVSYRGVDYRLITRGGSPRHPTSFYR